MTSENSQVTELEQTIAELQASQRRLSAALLSVADRQDWRPAAGEWSFREIAAHLEASERECVLPRVLAIASGSHPAFDFYWNTGRDFGPVDLTDSVARFTEARQRLIDFVQGLSTTRLSHTGHHQTFGEITVADYLKIDLEHDQGHLNDLARSFRAVYGGSALIPER